MKIDRDFCKRVGDSSAYAFDRVSDYGKYDTDHTEVVAYLQVEEEYAEVRELLQLLFKELTDELVKLRADSKNNERDYGYFLDSYPLT